MDNDQSSRPTAYRQIPMSEQRCTVGFGCAGLYGLPDKRDRRSMLERAYELGIRHFDVAPMYGLGIAETELAELVGRHDDVVVATKFGIRPTPVGHIAGRAQAPIRHLLQRSRGVKRRVKQSGTKRSAGIVGRLLYTSHDYSVSNARASLTASLKALRVDRIDYFLLHEPADTAEPGYDDLVGFLEDAHRQGLIGHWGPAGDLSTMSDSLTNLTCHATVLQMPYDLVSGFGGPIPRPDQTTITFGLLSVAMSEIQTALANDPALRAKCREMLDSDLAEERTLVRFLVRNALNHNPFGTVLLSSTKADNLARAYSALHDALPNEDDVASMVRQKCLELRGAE